MGTDGNSHQERREPSFVKHQYASDTMLSVLQLLAHFNPHKGGLKSSVKGMVPSLFTTCPSSHGYGIQTQIF